jgi:Protein NO VEIN, C-terminal
MYARSFHSRRREEMWWIYKVNSRRNNYQVDWGDWDEFFASDEPGRWGSTELIPKLIQARRGDMIIAYQTNRNELAGLAQVVRWQKHGLFQDLILEPVETIGAKVLPLKAGDPQIAKIPALRGGPIATLYHISRSDAQRLLRAARRSVRADPNETASDANRALRGAGFGTAEENKRVEQAAIDWVTRDYKKRGWEVENVSRQKLGYDLECTCNRRVFHVEVKGSRGTEQKFIITASEKRTWRTDRHFVLALVTNALGRQKSLFQFRGTTGYRHFEFREVSYVATAR